MATRNRPTCVNGHPQRGPVARYNANGRERYCTICGVDLDHTITAEPAPLWPTLLVIAAALALTAAYWWFVWLSPR